MGDNKNRASDDFDDDDIGIGRNIKKRHRGSGALKGVLFAIVLIFLVIGSFWVSFLIGKRILVPAKTLPKMEAVNNEVVPVLAAPKVPVPAAAAEKIEYPDLSAGAPVKKPVIKIKQRQYMFIRSSRV
ncbi:MAG: hypothetical protein AABZ57_05475, partial [Candidatus Margulisiibacteriota bacterium]